MSFLFVDKILERRNGEYVKGIKHVTANEQYLSKNIAGEWVLMPSVIGETLGQLAAWSVMYDNDFTLRPVAGVVSAVNIFDDAKVGDTIVLESFIDKVDDKAVQYHSQATVDGKVIFEIESALGPLLPMQEFIDLTTVKAQFSALDRPGEYSSSPNNVAQSLHFKEPSINVHASFDNLVAMNIGKSCIAQKCISLSAPYFKDHFPLKPVLPLTILLNCKLELASHFLAESFGPKYKATSVRKIKMSGFVQPGDVLTTNLELKSQDSRELIINFKSFVNNKRVCVATAYFCKLNSLNQ